MSLLEHDLDVVEPSPSEKPRRRRGNLLFVGVIALGVVVLLGAFAVATRPASDEILTSTPQPPAPPRYIVEARDGSAYESIIEGTSTRIERIRPEPAVLATLPEPLQIRVVDHEARRLVLANPLSDGADTYSPGPRPTTRLVVVDIPAGTHRAYDFDRNLEPEAFGIGTNYLFVVDHRPASNPTYYKVSQVDLKDGSFRELLGPDKQPLEDMTGTARHQVSSHGGEQLYTLYVQHGHDASHDPAAPATLPVAAFVHVLDLREGWAACVDLPGFGHGPADASDITISEDGATLHVTDTAAGKQARIATNELVGERMRRGIHPHVEISDLATAGERS